ncbi:hypothetical protein KP509_03G033600 [Ceratopteris richardii]|nr:hypothetical protein KP509_03G033600 [Ceratopteris richardii]
MHNESVEPDSFAFLSLFKACASIPDIKKGRVLHALARWEGFSSNIFVGNAIVSMYANHGLLPEAQQAFDELSHRTSVSWNLLISGCVQQGEWHKALDLHRQMQVDGAELDSFTFVSLFKACGSIPDLSFGRELHAHAKAKGLDSNPFVGNTIMCMYNKCGDLRGAEDAFCVLSGWDVFSWTCMLSAYVDHGEDESALLLYRQMCNEGIIPDDATFTVVLQACSMLAEKSDSGSALHRARRESLLQLAWALRADIHRSNRCLDVTVATAFVFLYGKCGSLSAAENTFSSIEHPDQAAWNAMLSAYIHNKQEEFALHLYVHMQKQDNSPNVITLVTVLHACGVLVEKSRLYGNGGRCNSIFMEIARSIHMDVCTQGFESDQSIANTLISVYGKCGVIVEADCIFNSTLEFDVVSWNAMLSGCVGLGQGEKALYLFEKMQGTHVIPDEVTYMAVCQASAKTGSLHICKHVHFIVLCVGYDSILAVQVTFMDTYGSLGRIVDAQAVFDCLLQPNDVSWNACMASQALVDIKTSISMLELMNQSMVRPNAVTLTSILSVCSHWGLVEDGFWYIYYMIGNNNISLEQTHLKLMIDILGRAEDFKRINWLLHYMPMYSDPVIWLSVLDICVSHGNFELGKQALDHVSLCRSQESGSFS